MLSTNIAVATETRRLHSRTIWLSGAVPEKETWGDQPVDRNVQEFVRSLSALIFKYGGRLLHGSHPSFTPVLLHQARRYLDASKASLGSPLTEPPLTLLVSEWFSTPQNRADWERWESVAEVVRTSVVDPIDPAPEWTPEQYRQEQLQPSLGLMRDELADRADAFVAVGGKWWSDVPGRAGVPQEFDRARAKNLPCFILGGFGGVSAKYVNEEPEWYRDLNNGLADERNQELAREVDLTLAAGTVVRQLLEIWGDSS